MTLEFTLFSRPGGLEWPAAERIRFDRTIARFKGGKPVKLILREVKKIRSHDQNALYWKRNGELSTETGYDKESLHEEFMRRAGYGKTLRTRTAEYYFRQSSRDLDTSQFSVLMGFQDELANFLNEDREPDHYIFLTRGQI